MTKKQVSLTKTRPVRFVVCIVKQSLLVAVLITNHKSDLQSGWRVETDCLLHTMVISSFRVKAAQDNTSDGGGWCVQLCFTLLSRQSGCDVWWCVSRCKISVRCTATDASPSHLKSVLISHHRQIKRKILVTLLLVFGRWTVCLICCVCVCVCRTF